MNNTKLCLLIVILTHLFITVSCKDITNCEQLKNGKFYYYTKGTREKIYIERLDSLQVETDSILGSSPQKSKIIWKSDCKYDMYINAFTDSKLAGYDSVIAATPAHVDVVYIGDTFYVCIAKMNVLNKNIELRDTIYFNR
jgi:hypothetical protein